MPSNKRIPNFCKALIRSILHSSLYIVFHVNKQSKFRQDITKFVPYVKCKLLSNILDICLI